MRKVYMICVRALYGLWALYLCSLLLLYLLGFFVDTLSLRWILIPETEIMLFITVLLSLAIVTTFVCQRISGNSAEITDRIALPGVLPSMAVLATTIIYLIQAFLR